MGGNSVLDHQLDQQNFNRYMLKMTVSPVEYGLALTQLKRLYPDRMLFYHVRIIEQVKYNRAIEYGAVL